VCAPGDPDPDPTCDDGTLLSVDRTSLPVTETSHASVLITDMYCNPVPDVPVSFTIDTGTNGVLTVVQGVTGPDGKAYATLTDTTAETVTLHATITQGEIAGSPKDIEFTSGDLDADHSEFSVYMTDPTATEVVADDVQSWTGKLIARDANDNLLPNLDVTKMAFTTTPAGVTVSSVVNEGNGVYTVTYTSKKAGDYTAALTYKSQKVGNDEPIAFVAGPVSPGNSMVTVNPSTQVVGAPVTITVTARDKFDNPVFGLPSNQVVVVGKDTGAKKLPDLALSNFQEIAPGVYTYSATSKRVGEFEVSATVTGVPLLQHPHVTFIHGGVCVSNCEPWTDENVTRFEMVTNDQLANGKAQDTAKAWAYDTYGNEVPGAVVVVTDQSTGALAGVLTPGTQTVVTGEDGTAMVAWTSTKVGTFTAEGTIDDLRPVTGVMSQIRFTNGAADPAMSEMRVTPASPIVVGNAYTVTVTAKDSTGNLVSDATVSFSLDPTTPASLSATTCVTNIDGECSVTVTSKLVTTVDIHGTLPKNGVQTDIGGNKDPKKASPQTVSFIAGPVCVVNCTPVDPTHVTRVEVVTDGVEANGTASDVAKVWAYDTYGNPVAKAAITSTTTDTALTIVTPIAATSADGTSEIDYRSTVKGPHVAAVRIAGLVPVTATSMDGTVTTDGTITLNFGSGSADASHSFLTIDPTTSQIVGKTFTVTAHLNDVNDNPVEGATVTFPAVTNLTFSATSCVSDSAGLCSVDVTSKLVGTYTVSGRLNGLPLRNTVDAQFTHGPVCTVNCEPVDATHVTRVEVTTNGQEADGQSRDIATAYAYDKYGNAVPGAVTASTQVKGETGLTVQPDIAVTDGNGVTSIWYTSTVRGTYHADVTLDGQIPDGSPVAVSFGNGNGDPAHSGWVITPASPLIVGKDAANTYTATATIHDKTDNAVPGAVVTFQIDPDGPTFDPVNTCVTNDSGVCSVKVWSTRSGTYAVSASIAQGPINNTDTKQAAASVAWKADQVCSHLEGCDPVDPNLPADLRTRVIVTTDYQVANLVQQDIATVWAFDKWGNAVEGGLVKSTTADSDLNIQTGINAIDKDGRSTIWYTTKVAGAHIANVTVDGFRPVGDPITLNFVAGEVCVVEAGDDCQDPNHLTHVAVTLNDQKIGGNDIVTAYAYDKYGNPVQAPFTIATSDTKLNLKGASYVASTVITTGADGTVTMNAMSWRSGVHLATATVKGVELTNHGSPLKPNFVGGPQAPVITGPEDGTVTNDNEPVIEGTGDVPGDEITVRDDDGVVCTATVQPDLTWSCSPDEPLMDGDHTLVADETDEHGNPSDPSNTVTITIDTVPPNPPVPDPSNGSKITGKTDKDTTVTVRDKDNQPVKGCIDIVPEADDTFVCYPETILPPFSEVTLVAKDPAGNVSDPSDLIIRPIRVEVAYPIRDGGETQVATAYNFNPYEEVCLTMASPLVEIECKDADANGVATFTYTVPMGTPVGSTQVVTATAKLSGQTSAHFLIATPQAVVIKTGGSVAHPEPLRGLVIVLIVAGATLGVRTIRRDKEGSLTS